MDEQEDYQEGIELTNFSVEEVKDRCAAIRRKAFKNAQSVQMAEGIADFAERKNFLHGKQCSWVARNCDFWKLPRPAALVHVKVPKAAKTRPAKQADASDDFDKTNIGFEENVIARLKSLIRLFESRV